MNGKTLRSISSLVFAWVVMGTVVTGLGCGSQPPKQEETVPQPVQEIKAVRDYDPLELTQDTVPATSLPGTRETGGGQVVKPSSIFPGGELVWRENGRTDSLGRQVFRVQLMMVETYSDARHALATAEEIFDQPVSLVYEVPYYKIRVGEFGNRREAETYQQKAQLAGYPNAWVMLSSTNVRQIQPMYELSDSTVTDSSRNGR